MIFYNRPSETSSGQLTVGAGDDLVLRSKVMRNSSNRQHEKIKLKHLGANEFPALAGRDTVGK